MNTDTESNKGKVIPATKRPDGTWRKERRVKDGYVPQEEVPLYESKGKQFVSQSVTGVPVGMCPLVAAELKKEREKKEKAKVKKEISKISPATASTKPNSDALAAKVPTTAATLPKPAKDLSGVSKLTKTLDSALTLNDDTQDVDVAKQVKKLRKKLREIELIESKIQAGDGTKLDKDQMDKAKKKSEILKQLKQFEEQQFPA